MLKISSAGSNERLHLSIALLYLGAILIGSLTVLLGCVLPLISTLMHLSDRDAGTLLMVQFACSASGALLVRRNFHRTLARGYALTALAIVALHVLPKQFAIPSIAAYGLGLGMAMTSNSMIIGRVFAARRGVALSLLNFCWSIGATLSPFLVAAVFRTFSVGTVSAALALVCAFFFGITLLSSLEPAIDDQWQNAFTSEPVNGVIAYFGLLAFLYVGIESATGNWMSTYASRLGPWTSSRNYLVTGCFWFALLLGRALSPLILLRMAEEKLYQISVVTAVAGVCLLLVAHSALLLVAGATVTGLGLAPLFPLTLSFFMAKAGQPRNSGWVFAISGFGGAILAWLTGFVSTSAGSLRIGLLVPAGAALLLLILASRLWLAGNALAGSTRPC